MSDHNEPLTPVVPSGINDLPGAEESGQSKGETLRMVIVAFAIVLFGLTIGVLFLLPKFLTPGAAESTAVPERIVESTERAKVIPDPPIPQIEPIDDAAKSALREQAQQSLSEIIALIDLLETKNVQSWGLREFEQAKAELSDGEKAYSEQRYAHANRAYQQAVQALRQLDKTSERVLLEALEAGELALASGNSAQATGAFKQALAIDPNNEVAKRGAKRATTLDEVLALINEATGYEEMGERDKALGIYQQALALDEDAAGARAAMTRIKAAKTETAFNQAMSRAFRELEQKKYQRARKSFLAAKAIKPGNTAANNAISEVDNLIKAERINALLKSAAIAEQNENWPEAQKHLTGALAVDSDLDGVNSRIKRARSRLQLEQLLLKFTREKERLRNDGVHREAEALLGKADAVGAPRTKLAVQSADLRRTIQSARTPVPVTLLSDARTDVTVYKVGTMGAFERKAVTLLPGRYVAVGKRRGFRDVRVEFDVKPGDANGPVDIRCFEKIAFGSS